MAAKTFTCRRKNRLGIFDYGPGWGVIIRPFPESPCTVELHQDLRPLRAKDCRNLAAFLIEAADWIEKHEATHAPLRS